MGILRGTHYRVDNLIKWFQVDIKQDRRECQALMYPTHEGPQMQSLPPCLYWLELTLMEGGELLGHSASHS